MDSDTWNVVLAGMCFILIIVTIILGVSDYQAHEQIQVLQHELVYCQELLMACERSANRCPSSQMATSEIDACEEELAYAVYMLVDFSDQIIECRGDYYDLTLDSLNLMNLYQTCERGD